MVEKISQRIFLALDTTEIEKAVKLTRRLASYIGGVKLGKEFFAANGPEGVRAIASIGLPIFLDLKFFDIPNTILAAVASVSQLKPAMISIHISGGCKMLKAAKNALKKFGDSRPLLIGVTVLTSFGDEDLRALGIKDSVSDQVTRLAGLALESGIDGVVCSAHEATQLRKIGGAQFKLVVPGVRPSWTSDNDQRRTATPAEAMRWGADYLVIGRPITSAKDPREAAAKIARELE